MKLEWKENQDREWVEMRGIAVAAAIFVMDEARMERVASHMPMQ